SAPALGSGRSSSNDPGRWRLGCSSSRFQLLQARPPLQLPAYANSAAKLLETRLPNFLLGPKLHTRPFFSKTPRPGCKTFPSSAVIPFQAGRYSSPAATP
ncbi:unnamed protein product, partial [Prunus brigantina]